MAGGPTATQELPPLEVSAPPATAVRAHRRVAELDGIRGIAILLVVVGHAFAGPMAASGVTLFFALSGFLITSILVGELEKRGRIDLKRFYLRRMTRLAPPLVFMVALVTLVFGVQHWHGIAAALTWTTNYVILLGIDTYPHSHTWSLAVEEQYYLVWPLALLALMTLRNKVRVLVGVLVLLLAWRLAILAMGHAEYGYSAFETAGSAILAGCVVALSGWRIDRQWPVLVSCAAFVGIVGIAFLHEDAWMWIPLFVTPFAAVVLAGADACPWLRWRWLGFFGVASYSMYLWHLPIGHLLAPGSEITFAVAWPSGVGARETEGFSRIGSLIGASLGIGAYLLLERPLMRWRAGANRRAT